MNVKTIDIRGKQYVTIAERVRILHEMRRSGEIQDFEMVESQPFEIVGQPYWRVSARINGKLYIGSAEIKLNAAKNTPDGTNPISCAETSAFGRMLAFAGLGTIDSIASAEDVVQAMTEQEQAKPQARQSQPHSEQGAEASQPDNVQPMRAKPQPRPATPANDGQINQGQINCLLSLYGKLDQVPPPDLPQWTFAQARQAIVNLQNQLKQAS